jgi:hypothetical protein
MDVLKSADREILSSREKDIVLLDDQISRELQIINRALLVELPMWANEN